MSALEQHSAICLGIYRRKSAGSNASVAMATRYVITNPHATSPLEPADRVGFARVYCV